MAEQEVAKHTKKIYKVWTSKEHTFWHKTKEFFIEIFIIVFAVSISIWFHNMSEHSHDKKEAKAFLVGLKSDLLNDIDEMRQDSLSFDFQKQFFRYLIDSSKTNLDSGFISTNFWLLDNRTVLVPNISRFEALKYSGKMNIIENKKLLDEILNLYEEKIPLLIKDANLVNDYKEKSLTPLLDKDMLLSTLKRGELLKQIKENEMLVYSFKRVVSYIPYILSDYHRVIEHNILLIKLIDEEIK